MEANIVINLPLFGETYKIKASADKEEVLRKYAHMANKYFDAGRKQYPGLKDRDYISMAIINLFSDFAATEPETKEETKISFSDKELIQKLEDISKILD